MKATEITNPNYSRTHVIEYKHCIFATRNEPDQSPFTRYQSRQAHVYVACYHIDGEGNYDVRHGDEVLVSNADNECQALELAAYELMKESRRLAYEQASHSYHREQSEADHEGDSPRRRVRIMMIHAHPESVMSSLND